MNAPAIKPTITQRVRAFLASHGAPLAPWASLDETYAQLFALLRRRKDDPTFWDPLAQLLQEIIDSAVDPQRRKKLAAPQAELLSSWDVDELVRNLKEALPAADATDDTEQLPDRAALTRFTAQLSAAMLGGFLLLGFVAAGCTDDAGSTGAGGAGGAGGTSGTTTTTSTTSSSSSSTSGVLDAGPDAPFEGPWDKDCSLEHTSILYTTIEQSSVEDEYKYELCLCFEGLNTSWDEGLTELFANGTAQEISTALGQLIQCCNDWPYLPDEYSEAEEQLLNGLLCDVPIYKGVSFPR